MKKIIVFLGFITALALADSRNNTHSAHLTFPIPYNVGAQEVVPLVTQKVSPLIKGFSGISKGTLRRSKNFQPAQQLRMPIVDLGSKLKRDDGLMIHRAILNVIKGKKTVGNLYLNFPHLFGNEIVLSVKQETSNQLDKVAKGIRSALKTFTRVNKDFDSHIILGSVPTSIANDARFKNAAEFALKKIAYKNANKEFTLGMINLYWDGKLWIQYYLPTQTYYQFDLNTGKIAEQGNF